MGRVVLERSQIFQFWTDEVKTDAKNDSCEVKKKKIVGLAFLEEILCNPQKFGRLLKLGIAFILRYLLTDLSLFHTKLAGVTLAYVVRRNDDRRTHY